MRAALFAMAVTGTALAGVAHAQDIRPSGSTRLQVTDTDPLPDTRSIVIARKLRLRVTGLATSQPTIGSMRLHGRSATAMIDVFPLDGSGLHVSAGTRFHVRRDFMAEANKTTRGLLYAPRGAGYGSRNGFKRFAPTATVGYLGALSPAVSLGIEAGARMGRAFNGGPRPASLGGERSGRSGKGQQPNPMVNMVLGLRF